MRDRKDDLPLLLNHFINQFNEKLNKRIKQFSSSAYELLIEYHWPGNIRELENAVEHCFILCSGEVIQTQHLPKWLRETRNIKVDENVIHNKKNLLDAEKELILSVLKNNKGNRTKTSQELKINPSTLWRKMKKLKIEY